jgi:hypothetical protein
MAPRAGRAGPRGADQRAGGGARALRHPGIRAAVPPRRGGRGAGANSRLAGLRAAGGPAGAARAGAVRCVALYMGPATAHAGSIDDRRTHPTAPRTKLSSSRASWARHALGPSSGALSGGLQAAVEVEGPARMASS